MAFGKYFEESLKKGEFLNCEQTRKNVPEALWVSLIEVAAKDIALNCPNGIDGDTATSTYYEIALNNSQHLPKFALETLPSNGQERIRVAIRNTFSSNAFHYWGLANRDGIKARKQEKERGKGKTIFFEVA